MTGERWQQVKTVLEAALPMDSGKRRAYLDQACAADHALRREVESLLAADNQAQTSFLQSPPLPTRLEKGTRLGDYEIQSLLGAGGMGEVYRARDLRLRREVAVKVLPAVVSSDSERLRRFEQEATAAAALNHPNILAVHQLGTYAGTPYLVSELLEGETLREQLRRGRIAVRRVIDYGVQIARGLAAAHEKGIVHRDLKPENLFITRDGRVKILDFGLAKLTQAQPGSERSTPTMGSETEPGLVMGTVGYMSPEQVRGQAADSRADIFALGAILYEMLTGKRAFQKPTSAETMAAILNEDSPGISQIAPTIPLALQRVVHRCLEKNPEQRFQSASDLAFAVEAISDVALDANQRRMVLHSASERVSRGLRWGWPVAGLATLVVTTGLLWFTTHRPRLPRAESKPRRLTANPAGNPAMDPRISSDGRYLAYDDQAGIHLQLIDTGETRTIPQPHEAGYKITGWAPAGWFPDGTKLLAQTTSLGEEQSSIWAISMLGGTSRKIHEGGFAWSVSPDGSLIAFTSTSFDSDIWFMGPDGEDPHRVITADEGEALISVVWFPNSRRIAYERLRWGPTGPQCSIESRDLMGNHPAVVLSDPKLVTAFGAGFWWSADGRLIYSRAGTNQPDVGVTAPALGSAETDLWETKVDIETGQPAGESRRITNWVDFSLANPNATSNGARVVFSRVSAQSDVYVGDLAAGGTRLKSPPRRLTLGERNDWPLAWTPDGSAVVFGSDLSGQYHIYKQALDRDSAEAIVTSPQLDMFPRLSADGAWILYLNLAKVEDFGTSEPLRVRRVAATGGPSWLVMTTQGFTDYRCARPPATLCLVGERTGDEKQLVFTAFDPVRGRGREMTRIVTAPGFAYNWDLSPDGLEIALLLPTGQNSIRLLPLTGGEPRDLIVNGLHRSTKGIDWAPDGKGFYVGTNSPSAATLVYVDLHGRASPMWEQKGSLATWGVPSPDRRHLAILGYNVDSNVWMLDNF